MVALAAISAGFTSCSDEPDKYESTSGIPTISYIRPVDVSKKDSMLVEATMDNPICIIGNNLRSIKQINFNDQKAVLNTSYITDHSIILTVPKTIPTTISDKIYFITTSNDTVKYDFKVTIPAPIVSSMSNEWAKPGEEVTLIGDYFLDYDNYPLAINVGDNYVIPRSNIKSISKTDIKFIVPEDMPKDYIKVSTKFGKTRAAFKYMDTRGMLFDFDTPWDGVNVLGNHGWHDQVIKSDETSLEGNYLMLGDVDMGANGAWNDGNFSFEYWPGTWNNTFDADGPKLNDVVDFTDFANMSLKFEMLIPSSNPWMSAPMQIVFAGCDKVTLSGLNNFPKANNTYFHAGDGWPRALYQPWVTNGGSYDTGDKWVTVTIPLTDFNMDWDGNKASGSYKTAEDFASLLIFVVKGGYNDKSATPEGTDCHPIIKIDNIRVVPNK